MKKDDIVTLTIDDIGTNGEGIGRTEGITLFIKDALPGDMVRAKIMKMKKTYGYARLMEILKESTMRCAYYGIPLREFFERLEAGIASGE